MGVAVVRSSSQSDLWCLGTQSTEAETVQCPGWIYRSENPPQSILGATDLSVHTFSGNLWLIMILGLIFPDLILMVKKASCTTPNFSDSALESACFYSGFHLWDENGAERKRERRGKKDPWFMGTSFSGYSPKEVNVRSTSLLTLSDKSETLQ